MGLMDSLKDLAGEQLGKLGGDVSLLSSLSAIVNEQGGIQGLTQKFKNSGLEHVVTSWVSDGAKLPISSEQITKVLGNPVIAQLVAKTGFTTEEVQSKLTTLLPEAVSKLSGFLKK